MIATGREEREEVGMSACSLSIGLVDDSEYVLLAGGIREVHE